MKLEKYLKLWKKFESQLETHKLSLYEFSINWDKFDDNAFKENYGRKQFLDNLEKMRKRKNKLKSVHQKSIEKMEEYIKYLDKGYIKQELHHSETYESLFD